MSTVVQSVRPLEHMSGLNDVMTFIATFSVVSVKMPLTSGTCVVERVTREGVGGGG